MKKIYSADIRFVTATPGIAGGTTIYDDTIAGLAARLDTVEMRAPTVLLHVTIRQNTGYLPVFHWRELSRFTRDISGNTRFLGQNKLAGFIETPG